MKALILAIALFSSVAHADFDNSCYAKLYRQDGKVHKELIERKAQSYLSKNLIVTFYAKRFGGDKPVDAFVFIENAKDRSLIASFSTQIVNGWDWNLEQETEFGTVKIRCQ